MCKHCGLEGASSHVSRTECIQALSGILRDLKTTSGKLRLSVVDLAVEYGVPDEHPIVASSDAVAEVLQRIPLRF